MDDLPRGSRAKSVRTQSNIDAVRESVQSDPTLSVACRSEKLVIPPSSLRRIMRNDLNLHAVAITNVHELAIEIDHHRNEPPANN